MRTNLSSAVAFHAWPAFCLAALLGFSGCGSDAEEIIGSDTSTMKQAVRDFRDIQNEGEGNMTFKITSSAFTQGHAIPKKYTGEGADISPPLTWEGLPEGTKELALICDDPDAPRPEPWVHWVIYKIPATATGLPEGVPKKTRLKEPAGAAQGKNSWPDGENIGYGGPLPPVGHGVHHYYFKLYALDASLDLEPGLDKKVLLEKMQGHILAEEVLMGTYERKKE